MPPVASFQPPVSRSLIAVVVFCRSTVGCVIRALLIHVLVVPRVSRSSASTRCEPWRKNNSCCRSYHPNVRPHVTILSYFVNHKYSFAHAPVGYSNGLHSAGRPSVARERVVVLFVAGDVRRSVAFLPISNWSKTFRDNHITILSLAVLSGRTHRYHLFVYFVIVTITRPARRSYLFVVIELCRSMCDRSISIY